MDIRQLTTFQKAATLLSFSRAAAELNYAQSSVTGQIRGLENTLGVELFERLSGRSVRLTRAGERFLPYAEQLLSLADEARSATRGGSEPAGRVLVGTMESIATYHMPPMLEFFHHRHPGLQVVLRPGSGEETVQALGRGALDLGLVMDVETRHAGMEGVVLRNLADGTVRRVELRRRLPKDGRKNWEPFDGVFGVGWVRHPVIRSGAESGFSALLDRHPLYFIDHGEDRYTHDAYGIHLGQEDRLTFVGPRDQEVTLHLIDTRVDSPTYGADVSFTLFPDPERYLLVPPGVGHAFEHLENVYTINRPRTLLPEDGGEYLPGNDVIDWPVDQRPMPSLRANAVPASREYYEERVADQKKLRAMPPTHSTPSVMMITGENGRQIRIALRKKVPAAS
ncbi:LysR family transcriptional regulator [Streptomyces hirsutus]|uniref:LysR family transcriptional regulator n=1 Tax=Streptomyces hirsutus TaxID=35620 RepID=A0ABZ1GFJ1_9ACTN|nr:LysR family transcriptional regulator [Streptomyces hirsutus]WSD04406.1 LysR family transcriptional regulator [Streptomyces hirsutus]WTD22204.1 LysR family transcriptional regulator [Streptomyces hirsutus]